MIPLWVLCSQHSAYDVFVRFSNTSGWDNMGAAYLTSQIYILWCCFGSDSVVHVSEEVKNASIVVPRAMWWSYIGNIIGGFIMLITMLFCIGPIEPVIEADWPYMVLLDRTRSRGLNMFFNILLWILVYLGNITALATCARETFAFSRDRGLPFSGWIGEMNRKWDIPFNAVYLISILSALLALIQLGSATVFNLLVSLSTLGLMSTYLISIGCVLWRRLYHQPRPPARGSLGRWGLLVDGFAFCNAAFICVLCCFPLTLPVGVADANWAPLIWVVVIIIAIVMYLLHGMRVYTAPVEFVAGRKAHGVGSQSSRRGSFLAS